MMLTIRHDLATRERSDALLAGALGLDAPA